MSNVPILLYSPFADIGDGLWQLWLVPACHFSERAVSFRSNRLAQLTLFCSLAYGRYWDRHGLPLDFRFLYTLVPGPISGLSKLQIPLKHRTLGFKNQRACQNPKKCSDNYQNMQIMLAVLRFKNGKNYAIFLK